jgi:hypothetical protein
LWDEGLRQQIYLGDDEFVARMQAQATKFEAGSKRQAEIPAAQTTVYSQAMIESSRFARAWHLRRACARRTHDERDCSTAWAFGVKNQSIDREFRGKRQDLTPLHSSSRLKRLSG